MGLFDSPEFGRYRLRQLLAEGGMAEIFVAEQGGSGEFSKLVAIKRMLPHMSRDPHFVSMFLDEARIASRLSHPNVIQAFDFGQIEGRYFLAMEYLAGENLAAVVRQSYGTGRPIPIQLALQILIAVCDGLHSAHEYAENGKPMNVVHRDISPSNIVITFNGGVKVVDFGIARAAERRQEATETGVVKGKFPYCSPEQFRTNDLDRRSDIFSVGVVLHELLTGQRLFKRENDGMTCLAVMNEEAPPPSKLRPEIPAELDRITLRALEKDRDKRYPTLLEMRRDLEKLISGPPMRLDEYMVDLFGQERIAEKSNPLSGVTRIPTVVDTSMQSPGGPGRAPDKSVVLQLTEADVAKENTSATAVLLTPSNPALQKPGPPVSSGASSPGVAAPRIVAPEVPPPAAVAAPVPAAPTPPKSRAPIFIGVAVVVAIAAAGLIAKSTMSKTEAPVTKPVAIVEPTQKPAASAELQIDSLPRGATLDVAGKALGASPQTVSQLAAGQYVVSAKLEGYAPKSMVVNVAEGEHKSVVVELSPVPARLVVTAPSGARVLFDGEDKGEARAFETQPGSHTLEVRLSGQKPFTATVELKPGEGKIVEATFATAKKLPPGSLDVACAPWCRVLVDGKDVGQPGPFAGLKIAAGPHELLLQHPPSGKSKTVSLVVKPGQAVRETASFR